MRAPALLVAMLLLVPTALAAGEFQVFYTEKASRFVAEGVAAEGETRSYRFVVAQENVTRVEFVLTWRETGDRAGLSRPDVFALSAHDPQGRPVESTVRSATGEARLVARDVNPLPRDGPADAETLDARLSENVGRAGQGEWRAWVKLEDTGNPDGAVVDKDNAFQLVALIHHYEGVAMRVVSLENPAAGSAASAAAELVNDAPTPWKLALAGLAVAACALGATIHAQSRKGRDTRVSPGGENTPPPGR